MRFLFLVIMAFSLIGCSGSDDYEGSSYQVTGQGESWVARVGERDITQAELSQMLAFYHAKPGHFSRDDLNKALEQLIEEERLYQKAIEKGFDKHPDYLIRRRRLLTSTYLIESRRERYQDVEVTQFDVELYYEQHKERYITPDMYRTALIKLRSDQIDYAVTLRQRVDNKVELSQGFGNWAEASLLSQTRHQGGLQGWNSASQPPLELPPQVWNKIGQPEVGLIYGPFEEKDGIYLVRIVDKRTGSVEALEAVYRQIRQQLLDQEYAEQDQEFRDSLKSQFKVEINQKLLEKTLPATSLSAPPRLPQ